MTVRRFAAALGCYTLREFMLLGYSLARLGATNAALRRSPRGLLAPVLRRRTSRTVTSLVRRASLERVPVIVAHAARMASATCLARAFVTQSLLSARGMEATVVIGAKREGERLAAHAWVEVAGRTIENANEQAGFVALHRVEGKC